MCSKGGCVFIWMTRLVNAVVECHGRVRCSTLGPQCVKCMYFVVWFAAKTQPSGGVLSAPTAASSARDLPYNLILSGNS